MALPRQESLVPGILGVSQIAQQGFQANLQAQLASAQNLQQGIQSATQLLVSGLGDQAQIDAQQQQLTQEAERLDILRQEVGVRDKLAEIQQTLSAVQVPLITAQTQQLRQEIEQAAKIAPFELNQEEFEQKIREIELSGASELKRLQILAREAELQGNTALAEIQRAKAGQIDEQLKGARELLQSQIRGLDIESQIREARSESERERLEADLEATKAGTEGTRVRTEAIRSETARLEGREGVERDILGVQAMAAKMAFSQQLIENLPRAVLQSIGFPKLAAFQSEVERKKFADGMKQLVFSLAAGEGRTPRKVQEAAMAALFGDPNKGEQGLLQMKPGETLEFILQDTIPRIRLELRDAGELEIFGLQLDAGFQMLRLLGQTQGVDNITALKEEFRKIMEGENEQLQNNLGEDLSALIGTFGFNMATTILAQAGQNEGAFGGRSLRDILAAARGEATGGPADIFGRFDQDLDAAILAALGQGEPEPSLPSPGEEPPKPSGPTQQDVLRGLAEATDEEIRRVFPQDNPRDIRRLARQIEGNVNEGLQSATQKELRRRERENR